MSRRTFVHTSLAAAAASAIPSPRLCTAHARTDRRCSSYSVRELMKADVPGTLAKIAAIGFKEVEFAGLFDRVPRMYARSSTRTG